MSHLPTNTHLTKEWQTTNTQIQKHTLSHTRAHTLPLITHILWVMQKTGQVGKKKKKTWICTLITQIPIVLLVFWEKKRVRCILVHTVNCEETKIYLQKKNNLTDCQVSNGIDIDLQWKVQMLMFWQRASEQFHGWSDRLTQHLSLWLQR